MDPDANLIELRRKAAEVINIIDAVDVDKLTKHSAALGKIVDDANRLAELVQALDGWISKGGFLPASWKDAARDAARR